MLSGSLTCSEKQELLHILDTPVFEAALQDVLDEQGGVLLPQKDFISLQAHTKLKAFRELIDREAIKTGSDAAHSSSWKKYRWYAAAVLLIIACGVMWKINPKYHQGRPSMVAVEAEDFRTDSAVTVLFPEIKYKEYYHAKRTRRSIRLADGTVVTMGYKSRLRYPEQFEADKRNVFLEGEAFFEVAKDTRRPFTVISGKVHTKVLGTSFKVVTQKTNVEVAVVTGKVSVNYMGGDSVLSNLAIMLPGDKAVWRNHHITLSKVDTKTISGWKNGLLIFNKETLKHILTDFCKKHTIQVEFLNKGFAEEKLSVSLEENTSIQKVLNILSASTGFEYKIDSLNGRPSKVTIK